MSTSDAGRALPGLSSTVPGTLRSALDAIVMRAIEGVGPLKGAVEVAEEHRGSARNVDEAIDRLIATHVRLAGANGFVCGLGGLMALPVTLPAGVGGLYLIAARLTAGIAHLRGFEVRSEEVRSALALCLLGSAGAEAARHVGVEASRRFLTASLRRMSARPLMAINRAVGFRLVTKAGTTGVVNLSKGIPLVGGPVGALVDRRACRAIAHYAEKVFARPPEGSDAPLP